MKQFSRGLYLGVPIGLGYLSVSFSFGIIAVGSGLSWWQALLISMLTLTSAGQLAAVGMMALPGQYIPLLISQLTINLRYSFMSVSLSQRVSRNFRGVLRLLLGFFITDEIFAVASREEEVTPAFFLGLSVIPYLGWSLGTLVGALVGSVLPRLILDALSLAIYGMFLAILLPAMRRETPVLTVVLISAAISCIFFFLLPAVPSGIAISVSALVAATLGALFFPIREEVAE